MPIRVDGQPAAPLPPQPEWLPPAALWRPEQWRFHLYGLHWDGTQELLAQDVPVSDPEVVTTLSGTDTIRGTLTPELPGLKGLVDVWATAVMAEFEDAILAMCIVEDDPVQDAGLAFTSVGFFGYLQGTPHLGDYSKVQVDPLDVARDIWSHVQGFTHGNLGVILDPTTSPVRIGTDPKDVQFQTSDGADVAFEAGPYTLGWWKTDDLSADFVELATSTPFDFAERHTWNGPGSGDIEHRIALGYPKLGRRRHDLRFEVGENVSAVPTVDTPGADYASDVLFLGAGEGKKMLRSTVATSYRNPLGRAWRRGRRVAVVDDKSLDSQRKVNAAANAEAAWRTGNEDVTSITVIDHPNAPFTSWANGDEVNLTGRNLPWVDEVDLWVRVLSTAYRRDEGVAELTVARAERTNRQ